MSRRIPSHPPASQTTASLVTYLSQALPTVQPLPSSRRLTTLWLGILLAGNLVLLCWHGFRPDLSLRLQEPVFVLTLLGWLLVLIIGSITAVRLATPRWPVQPGTYAALFVFALVFCVFLGTMVWEGLQSASVITTVGIAWPCILITSLLATLAGITGYLILQRGKPSAPGLLSLSTGVTAAAAGMLAITAVCTAQEYQHILLSHVIPALVVGGLTILFGKFFSRW